MPKRPRKLYLCAVLIASCAKAPPAELAFVGGSIHTMLPSQPTAELVTVTAGRITYVGGRTNADDLIGPQTTIVDLGERLMLPGFHDTHVHPLTGGLELGECDLNPARSVTEVTQAIEACAARDRTAPWIRGGGYQLTLFPEGIPSRQLLDTLVPDRPVYLTAADGHSAWVNTAALDAAGVDRTTPDPPGGMIVREPDGTPAGALRERAMDLVARHLPRYSDAEYRAGLQRGLALAARFGITTLHEANAPEAALRAYAAAETAGELTARVIVSLQVDPHEGVAEVQRLTDLRDRYSTGELLRPVAAKIFADGVIETHTAALLEPYLDRPGFVGALTLPPATFEGLVVALGSAGFKVHVHAIGDRAVHEALNAFARLRGETGGAGPRPIIAHAQLVHPDDIPRFARLGVVASFQPVWAYEDSYIRDLTVPRLGPERSRWLYPIGSVMTTGAIVAAGSDWSVTSMNPLRAVEVAITRRNPDLTDGPAWIPEERVSLVDILTAYTRAGAMAGDLEHETGSIEVGKAADLVILEENLFEIPVDRISEVTVWRTYLGGREVYRK